jgi:hypothetical protein
MLHAKYTRRQGVRTTSPATPTSLGLATVPCLRDHNHERRTGARADRATTLLAYIRVEYSNCNNLLQTHYFGGQFNCANALRKKYTGPSVSMNVARELRPSEPHVPPLRISKPAPV